MTAPYIFMSHSSKDRDFTARMAARLHDAGFRCWVDVEDIPDGSTWMREIEKAVTGCGAMIVVMSKDGRESEWVERETLMGMELRKPLFIARIDDVPLPLHLINRQYTDFRSRPEAAYKKLIAALHKAPLTEPLPEPDAREQKKHSPEPNRLNFFKYLEQLPDGADNARIARALFAWAQTNTDSLTFSGRSEPAFHANLWVGPGGVTIYSVRAYRKQPAVEVPLQFLMNFPPYDKLDARLRLLAALDQFVMQPFEDDRADRRPNIPLISLEEASALQAFTDLVGGIVDSLRASSSETPHQP
ncbi:MAG: toll/interleukin-1 receptor domain-containing protein [Anaerolineae bacterium]|nr:toll/interleukin-1 receptor domain-containing protein [Anaerolineae bacterium]